jgi:hypothetical protein
MLRAPSAATVAPVINELSSLARNTTMFAISAGVAWRPSGIISSKTAFACGAGAPIASTSMAV